MTDAYEYTVKRKARRSAALGAALVERAARGAQSAGRCRQLAMRARGGAFSTDFFSYCLSSKLVTLRGSARCAPPSRSAPPPPRRSIEQTRGHPEFGRVANSCGRAQESTPQNVAGGVLRWRARARRKAPPCAAVRGHRACWRHTCLRTCFSSALSVPSTRWPCAGGALAGEVAARRKSAAPKPPPSRPPAKRAPRSERSALRAAGLTNELF